MMKMSKNRSPKTPQFDFPNLDFPLLKIFGKSTLQGVDIPTFQSSWKVSESLGKSENQILY